MKSKFPKALAINIVLFLSLPVLMIAQEKPDTIVFIHITDTHICNLKSYHPLFTDKRRHFGEGFKPFINFLGSVPEKLQTDFIVITGDMIDYYEAETTAGDMLDTQIEQFVKSTNDCNIPVYMTLGNHDISSYKLISEKTYNSHQYNDGKARAAWIRNTACFRNGTYYSRTFQADTTTYRLIFLDNAYYSPGKNKDEPPYIIDQFQLQWLNNELNMSDNDVELIFMHIPLLGGIGIDGNKKTQVLRTNYSDSTGDIFNVLGQKQSACLIFSGHKHRNIIYKYEFSGDYALTQVETGAFGRIYEPNNWRLIQLTAENIIISYPGDEKRNECILHISDIKRK